MDKKESFLFEAAMGYEYCKKTQHYEGSTMEEMLKKKYGFSYNEYLDEIKRIQNLCRYKTKDGQQKEIYKIRFGHKENFLKWYFDHWSADGSAKCYYCGVTERECRETLGKLTERATTRSQHLEIERLEPKGNYDSKNCVLACYVCNNAKSDFMSEEEFKELIPGIQAFWKSQREKQNKK